MPKSALCPTCHAPERNLQPAITIGGHFLTCSDPWHSSCDHGRSLDEDCADCTRAIAEACGEPFCPDCFHFWDAHGCPEGGCSLCGCTENDPPANASPPEDGGS